MSRVIVLGQRETETDEGLENRMFWYFVDEKELNLDRLRDGDLIIHFTAIEEVKSTKVFVEYKDIKDKLEVSK